MTFDPDRPAAHSEARAPVETNPPAKRRRGPADDEERWVGDAMVELRDQQDMPEIVRSFGDQYLAQGTLSDRQWDVAKGIAHRNRKRVTAPAPDPAWKKSAPKPPLPVPKSALELEASEVESQLDALLRDPHGDRCVLAVDEATGRAKSIDRALGLGPCRDGPLATTPRVTGVGFGACGSCFIGGARGCARCARGEAHPGQPCDSPHRTRFCRGWSLLATLRARALDARGDHEFAAEVRESIGLEVKP